eukprot:PITA_28822
MKITLKLDAKPVKKRPYCLNLKYKDKVHLELQTMLAVGIIELVEEFDWNSLAIFSRVVVAALKEFIHKFLEVYFDDYAVFGLVKCHVASLCLMLDTCQRYNITLNLKKCLFCAPFGNILRHAVCRQGLMLDLTKIMVILNLEALRSLKPLRATLGHTGYYMKFIKSYAQITAPMEKLLNKDVRFYWNDECKKNLDILKEKMVTTPIIVFPN